MRVLVKWQHSPCQTEGTVTVEINEAEMHRRAAASSLPGVTPGMIAGFEVENAVVAAHDAARPDCPELHKPANVPKAAVDWSIEQV